MDRVETTKDILGCYEEIVIDTTLNSEFAVAFTLHEKKFVLICPDENNMASRAMIYVLNEEDFNYPHIMLREVPIKEGHGLPAGLYRMICLHEQDTLIASLQTFEEKITDVIDRLITLMNLTPLEIEHEFQKEFMFYWNSVASDKKVHLYIGQKDSFAKLSVYQKNDEVRYVAQDILLNDINECNKGKKVWQERVDYAAFYIPITDRREIIPSHCGKRWGLEEVHNVIYGKRMSHISRETFLLLKQEIINAREIALVFEMDTDNMPVTFVVKITCKNNSAKTLYEKIMGDAVQVEEMRSVRNDYYTLNSKIGNSCNVIGKTALLVGAGSLGSYVAAELTKNGFNKIKIYDSNKLTEENTMRWVYGGSLNGVAKPSVLKFFLEQNHPEINIEAVNKNLEITDLQKEVEQVDLIIFTVGSTDVQLQMNRLLKSMKSSVPVIYVWLEAGGQYSHILTVDYKESGCFECLYTDQQGTMINNKVNLNAEAISEQNILRNGCGGTRAAYGTAILLRTTAVLLENLKQIFDYNVMGNRLIDITPNEVRDMGQVFIAEGCRCCGDRNIE